MTNFKFKQNVDKALIFDFSCLLGISHMKGHSWRCFYRIMRHMMRWGCDRGADERVQMRGCIERTEPAVDAKRRC